MVTTRSPLERTRRAHALGRRLRPDRDRAGPHRDFTRPPLFARPAVREYQRPSCREAAAFSADVPAWLAAAGPRHARAGP